MSLRQRVKDVLDTEHTPATDLADVEHHTPGTFPVDTPPAVTECPERGSAQPRTIQSLFTSTQSNNHGSTTHMHESTSSENYQLFGHHDDKNLRERVAVSGTYGLSSGSGTMNHDHVSTKLQDTQPKGIATSMDTTTMGTPSMSTNNGMGTTTMNMVETMNSKSQKKGKKKKKTSSKSAESGVQPTPPARGGGVGSGSGIDPSHNEKTNIDVKGKQSPTSSGVEQPYWGNLSQAGGTYNTIMGHGSNEDTTTRYRMVPHVDSTTRQRHLYHDLSHQNEHQHIQSTGVYNTVVGHGSSKAHDHMTHKPMASRSAPTGRKVGAATSASKSTVATKTRLHGSDNRHMDSTISSQPHSGMRAQLHKSDKWLSDHATAISAPGIGVGAGILAHQSSNDRQRKETDGLMQQANALETGNAGIRGNDDSLYVRDGSDHHSSVTAATMNQSTMQQPGFSADGFLPLQLPLDVEPHAPVLESRAAGTHTMAMRSSTSTTHDQQSRATARQEASGANSTFAWPASTKSTSHNMSGRVDHDLAQNRTNQSSTAMDSTSAAHQPARRLSMIDEVMLYLQNKETGTRDQNVAGLTGMGKTQQMGQFSTASPLDTHDEIMEKDMSKPPRYSETANAASNADVSMYNSLASGTPSGIQMSGDRDHGHQHTHQHYRNAQELGDLSKAIDPTTGHAGPYNVLASNTPSGINMEAQKTHSMGSSKTAGGTAGGFGIFASSRVQSNVTSRSAGSSGITPEARQSRSSHEYPKSTSMGMFSSMSLGAGKGGAGGISHMARRASLSKSVMHRCSHCGQQDDISHHFKH
ncbi:hypothetical protein BX600DRAFT_543253 [Xylariales sp. PMI_506]|nr:hypothetical protein BX600DRAFT_543253 [Xylariales sp. PMI_506]